MVNKCKSAGIKCILMSPYYLELNEKDLMRAKMDEYRLAMKAIAEDMGVDYIDLQKPFENILQYRYPAYISWDRVHPGNVGALVIAKTFLKHIGFDFDLLKKD
jgi:sugar phosphate isomerase/epimerase